MMRERRTPRARWCLAVASLAFAFAIGVACAGGGGGDDAQPPAGGSPGAFGPTPPGTIVAPGTPEQGTPEASEGIGVFPASLSFDEALRGGEYFGTVGVINGGSEDRVYELEASGDVAPWITLVRSDDRTTTVNEVSVPGLGRSSVILKAIVPDSAPNGTYTGFVRVLTRPSSTDSFEQSGSGITLGAEVSVTLDVTGTQRVAGEFVDVAAADAETGFPVRITTTILNSGNVVLKPTIVVDIQSADGTPPEQLSFDDAQIAPGAREQLVREWDTTGLRPGARTARVHVVAGGLDLGTKELAINVLPAGTFTRSAELESIVLANSPQPGELAKLVAQFKNTGQIESRGKFVGELYMGDRLIDTLGSDEELVMPGGVTAIEFTARVDEKGEYTIRGKINYEGRETDEQSLTFKVGGGVGGVSPLLVAAGAVAVVVAVGGGWGLMRRRGRRAA
jgi:hypothetical protein